MIRQISYLSTAHSEHDAGTLDDILAVSRRNNERDDLSGLLAFGRGLFFQVLEGPDAPLEAALSRIGRDDRHTGIQMLSDERRAARDFGVWRMAYEVMTPQPDAASLRSGHVALGDLPTIMAAIDNPLVTTFLRRIAAQAG